MDSTIERFKGDTVSSGLKRRGGGGGGGIVIERLETVYAWAHTLLAYTTTILCCMNTAKRGGTAPPSPLLGETLTVYCKKCS